MAESPEQFPRYDKLQRVDAFISFKDILPKLVWKKKEGNRILDVACGKGDTSMQFLMSMLPSNYEEILGVDRSEEHIAVAKEKNCPKDSKVAYQVMDIEQNLSMEFEGKFNLVTAFYCHYWVVNIEKAIENLGKCVSPGGNFIFSFVVYNYYEIVLTELSKTTKWAPHMKEESQLMSPFQSLRDVKKEIAAHLNKAGFQTAHYNSWPNERPVSPNELIEFLKPLESLKPEVTQDQQQDFLIDLREAIEKLGFFRTAIVEGRQYIMKYILITIHAVKSDEATTVEEEETS